MRKVQSARARLEAAFGIDDKTPATGHRPPDCADMALSEASQPISSWCQYGRQSASAVPSEHLTLATPFIACRVGDEDGETCPVLGGH